jgi:DNA-binding transcriptional regulator GbsR (MarR family)
MNVRGIPELNDLADEVGNFMCYWGFKKIHGRIWTHVFLSKTPLDAADLMERLSVSKALVSLSLSDLLEHNVLLEAGKSERGTQTYVANPDVLGVILDVLRCRERKLLAQAMTAHTLLMESGQARLNSHDICPTRIAELKDLIGTAQNTLNSFLELVSPDLDSWGKFRKEGLMGPSPLRRS